MSVLDAAKETPSSFESELIIGLVSAVGVETQHVVELLKEQLGLAGYETKVVKVSRDVIPLLTSVRDYGDDSYQRYSELMNAGNKCRQRLNVLGQSDDGVLALGVASAIGNMRKRDLQGRPAALEKTAIIVDSLKRPEEVAHLRTIYPSGFILLGVHADENRRLTHLTKDKGIDAIRAQELLDRDRAEHDLEHGQRVEATYHLADFFVRVTGSTDRLRADIRRLVELWFGNPFITPTFDEYAMFLAYGAGLRSADLSRQVGAVIARNREVLSTGANECPKFGGGLYWPVDLDEESGGLFEGEVGSARDVAGGRDYTRDDGDSNRAEQLRMIDRITDQVALKWPAIDRGELRKILEHGGIRELIEFGRVVHAEMEAILSCARTGNSTVDATLYCTTFPCHTCAKHIVAAGIARVVYVEPYAKSKAMELHDDSITTQRCDRKVLFEPFVGVGPRRFIELFSMNLGTSYRLIRKDKNTGKRKPWRIKEGELRFRMSPSSYLEFELDALLRFQNSGTGSQG